MWFNFFCALCKRFTGVTDVSGLVVFWCLVFWKAPAVLKFAYKVLLAIILMVWTLAFWVVVLWSNGENLLVSSFYSQLFKSSATWCVSDFFTNEESLCVAQKLEEAAANAAEEEHRRLQTQSELQDLYRVEMEKEKMVVACSLNLVGDSLASILLTWLAAPTLLCPLISCT